MGKKTPKITTMNFILMGEPISKARHRHSGKRSYDPQNAKKLKCRIELNNQMHEKGLKSFCIEPLDVKMTFHCPIPLSFSRARKNAFLENEKLGIDNPCIGKKDLDNMIKFVSDCMNDLVYKDDRQITKLIARKIYSEHPRVEIYISVHEEK